MKAATARVHAPTATMKATATAAMPTPAMLSNQGDGGKGEQNCDR
jgi:hypothetical protein